jgi:hypothetical protein
MDLWAKQHIHVQGRPDWVFVKVHTHGYVLSNREVLLGDSMRRLHEYLSSQYNDGKDWFLHYVTAREMYNIVRAAEDCKTGNPGEFRDYEISPPPCMRGRTTDDGRQMTDDRRQKTDDRRQKTEDRRQKTEH